MKLELAFNANLPEGESQHWHLVFDREAPGLYVEHTRVRRGDDADDGTARSVQRYGINDFLSFETHAPAREGLLRALKGMFPRGEVEAPRRPSRALSPAEERPAP